jgi:hypothetical protein
MRKYWPVNLHLETRRISLAGNTRHPTQEWMTRMARNAVDEESGDLRHHRYLLHDRDTKFRAEFRKTLATGEGFLRAAQI